MTTNTNSSKQMELEVENPKKTGMAAARFNKNSASEGRRDKERKPKVRKLNPVNTISYVQILGTGMDTHDTSASVYLFFNNQRFIFNAGEGLQRFCTEHKIKLSQFGDIFLSRVCSETAGGLPGLLLTLASTCEEGISVNVWGPSDGLKCLVDAMKSFIPNVAMDDSRTSDGNPHDQHKLIDNEVVKISAILLSPKCPEKTHDEFAIKSSNISVLYICELPKIVGKFNKDRAKELGVKPGPKYGKLQEGISVKSDELDIMVNPGDVLGDSVPGPIVLLVDCPTLSHFQELFSSPSLDTYYGQRVSCVIHLSPALLVNSTDYRRWMSRFCVAEHIIAAHQTKNVEIPILQSSARVAARLNYLCPQFFPAKLKCSTPPVPVINEGPKIVPAQNLLKFILLPSAKLGTDTSGVPETAGPLEIISDLLLEIPDISDAAKKVADLWKGDKNMSEEPWLTQSGVPSCLEGITPEDVEIVLLGTGSSQPSKYRNVSSIFINLFSKGSVLLDCGEGTLGQLRRRFGIQGADDAVKSLKCIWISHIHADHNTGLARILALRRDLLKGVPHERLIVIGPCQLKRFLEAYERLEELDMQFLDCRNTMQSIWKRPNSPSDSNSLSPIIKSLKDVLKDAGLDSVISFPVEHCLEAFGVALKGADRIGNDGQVKPGWKIVYSGDTMPCEELIEASQGATVLIHEATFEDAMAEEAIAKKHSTTGDAIRAGNEAGVYRMILTHFSQRYPKIPVFDESHMHKTFIAFDMMSVNFADLHVLPRVLPYLKLLFKNEMVVDEADDVKKSLIAAA